MVSGIRYKRTSHCTAKNGEYNTGKNRGKKRVLAALLMLVEPMIDGLFVHKVSPENNSDCQSVPLTRTKTDSAPVAVCPHSINTACVAVPMSTVVLQKTERVLHRKAESDRFEGIVYPSPIGEGLSNKQTN